MLETVFIGKIKSLLLLFTQWLILLLKLLRFTYFAVKSVTTVFFFFNLLNDFANGTFVNIGVVDYYSIII